MKIKKVDWKHVKTVYMERWEGTMNGKCIATIEKDNKEKEYYLDCMFAPLPKDTGWTEYKTLKNAKESVRKGILKFCKSVIE